MKLRPGSVRFRTSLEIIGALDDVEIAGDGIGLRLVKRCLRAVGGFVGEAGGDFIERAAANKRQVLAFNFLRHNVRDRFRRQAVNEGRNAAAFCAAICGETFQHLAKGMGPPEMMLQAVAPARRHRRVFQQRGEEAEVAQRHAEFGEACGFQGTDRQFQNAGFGCRRIGCGKPFKAGLEEFLRAQVFIGKAEGGAEIAIFCFLVGLFRMAQVIAAGGHREVRAQAHFSAGGIGEHKGPGADVFAGALKKNIGGLDDVGGDVIKSGALEHRHDGGILPFQRLALGFRFTGHGPAFL